MEGRAKLNKDDFEVFESILKAGFEAGYEAGKQAVDPDPFGVNEQMKEISYNMCIFMVKTLLT